MPNPADITVTEAELAASEKVHLPKEIRKDILTRWKQGQTVTQICDVLQLKRHKVRAVVDPNYTNPKNRKSKSAKRAKVEAQKKGKAVEVEVKDPVEAAYAALLKNKSGLAVQDLTEDVLRQLNLRGISLTLGSGRIRLGTNPEALVNMEPVRGMFDPSRKKHSFAVITDTHIGGYQFQSDFTIEIFREAERRGCSFVAHVGDHVDGATKMHAGFEYELALPRAEDQAAVAVEVYQQCGIPLVGIGGNHDGSLHKSVGLDVCAMIARQVEQFKYIGPISGWIEGPQGDPNFIRLFHPGDGCSYALSYKDQKTAEFLALSGDKSPTGFHFTGHYHKFNHMRGPNGARYYLAPAACGTTDFMRAKRLVNQAGALFIEFTLDVMGRVDRVILEDVMLHPDNWARCDYSKLKPKKTKISTAGLW